VSVLEALLPRVGAAVIRSLGATWRIRVEDRVHVEAARTHHPQVIYAFWHGRLLPLSYTHRDRRIQVLASEHRDGDRLGRVIVRLGFGHVKGSSTRGGTRALYELSEQVRAGHDLGITVDGPRGPRFVAKPGALEIARSTGACVVPITTASSRHRELSSWDRFQIPAPFSRVIVRHGPPIAVRPDAGREEIEIARAELDATLRQITDEADRDASR